MLVSPKRDLAATRRFFTRALEHSPRPAEVNTDRAPRYLRVLDELLPSACHVTEQYANNTVEAEHGRLKSRLRPMRGLKQLRSTQVIGTGDCTPTPSSRGHSRTRRRAPPMFGKLSTVGGALLPRSRFGMRTEPGAHQTFLDVHRIWWCGGSAATQLSQL